MCLLISYWELEANLSILYQLGLYFWEIIQSQKCIYSRCVAVCFHLHFMEIFCMRGLLLTKSSKWSWKCLALQRRTSKGSQDFHRLDEGSSCQCLLTLNHSTKLQKAHQLWRGWIYIDNYICALFLLNTISAFGCGLLASGVGIGYWICGFTNICYHSFLSSFCICNFSCRSFPGRRFSLEGCLLF